MRASFFMSSKRRRNIVWKLVCVIPAAFCLALLSVESQGLSFAQAANQELGVTKLIVNGWPVKLSRDGVNRLPSSPHTIALTCGPIEGIKNPLRFRFKLVGYDADWREVTGQMRIIFSFLDEPGNVLGKEEFLVSGQTTGWTGSFQTSPLEHREETFVAPPEARRLWITIISAGSPQTLGAIGVCDLVVRTPGATNRSEPYLLDLNADLPAKLNDEWMRDGTQIRMAQIKEIGGKPRRNALVIVDDDPYGHAQWNTLKTKAPVIAPGQKLVAEWNQMFSIGMGVPTGELSFLELDVPVPFWKTQWFLGTVFFSVLAGLFLGHQYRARRRLQAENLRLAQQQVLERERIRIAQDIHDDLGAQVTQITLVSAMAERAVDDAQASKQSFQRITELSRKLVAALYDTVWVVNPENDNLEAVGNYLCQMFNQLISPAGLSCRMEVPTLPSNLPISSHQRHNLAMAVKEATNNIIKHAGATEARMSVRLENAKLHISIEDNGIGFDPESAKPGSGMGNLRRRLADVGGSAEVKGRPGAGTQVHLHMPIGQENFRSAEGTRCDDGSRPDRRQPESPTRT